MNRKLAPVLAIGLLLALAGVASAHTATPSCEQLTLGRAPNGSTADVMSGNTVVLNDVAGNGTYQIAAGTYSVVWSDGYKVNEVVVGPCEQPTPVPPTPTPVPTPCTCEEPTPVPPTPTPVPTPTAKPSQSVEAATGTPKSTPPPTDTAGTSTPDSGSSMPLLIVILGSVVLGAVVMTPNRQRR